MSLPNLTGKGYHFPHFASDRLEIQRHSSDGSVSKGKDLAELGSEPGASDSRAHILSQWTNMTPRPCLGVADPQAELLISKY